MAVGLDSSDDYLYRAVSLPSGTAFTVTLWYRRGGAGSWDTMFAFTKSSPENDAYLIQIDEDFTAIAMYSSNGGLWPYVILYGSLPTVGEWYFIWMVSPPGTNQDLTGDFLPISEAVGAGHSLTVNTYVNPDYRLLLGSFLGTEILNGRLAAVKIWDARLSIAEIERERWSVLPRRTSDLHLWSPLMVNSTDYSGNGKNWIESGTLTWEDGPPVGWGAAPLFVGWAPPPPYIPGRGFAMQQRMG